MGFMKGNIKEFAKVLNLSIFVSISTWHRLRYFWKQVKICFIKMQSIYIAAYSLKKSFSVNRQTTRKWLMNETRCGSGIFIVVRSLNSDFHQCSKEHNWNEYALWQRADLGFWKVGVTICVVRCGHILLISPHI